MKTITFECETLTPTFCYGADGSLLELRAPSLKGAIRFWWRAANHSLSIKNLRKKEAEIFGGTGEDEGKSKIAIKVKTNGLQVQKSLWEEVPFIEITSKKGKKYKIPTEYKSIPYLFYSTMMLVEKSCIKTRERFEITFSSHEVVALQHTLSAFWLLSVFGGIGSRSRRGAGSFRITNIKQNENELIKSIGLEFTLQGKNSTEVANYILKNFQRAKEIINEKKNTFFVSEYSNLSIARFIISKNKFNSWKDALNDIGNVFMSFRNKHRSKVFEVACFGIPIQHRNPKTTIIAGKVRNRNIKEKIDRRSSPVIFKVIRTSTNDYYWLLMRLAGEFLPEDKVLISNKDGKSQKPDYSLLDEFWNEVKNKEIECILSIPNELDELRKKIKQELSPQEIVLFGSRARGDFHKKSDIDLAVATNKSIEFANVTGNIDLINLNKIDDDFKKKIEKEGIKI